jgi:hypothetical protein
MNQLTELRHSPPSRLLIRQVHEHHLPTYLTNILTLPRESQLEEFRKSFIKLFLKLFS